MPYTTLKFDYDFTGRILPNADFAPPSSYMCPRYFPFVGLIAASELIAIALIDQVLVLGVALDVAGDEGADWHNF